MQVGTELGRSPARAAGEGPPEAQACSGPGEAGEGERGGPGAAEGETGSYRARVAKP